MKKETINTFSDGMSLDLNPLGTPAKILTNCLNGTLITYNGNELTLQNDMGNTQVGTAALPKGYVPVGMKEHGGIIYVASYNPETKKGQLGCFPSPQQIYVSEAALTILEMNIQELFIRFYFNQENGKCDIPVIEWNEYKEEIFKDTITQEAKIFNIGDKYIIKTNKPFSDDLRQAIDNNVIVFKLFIIPTNGDDPIEISSCDRNDLITYDSNWHKDLWIYENVDNIPFETILNDRRDLLQTYPGPQGTLEIVIEFNTFQLFNLYREFTQEGNNFNVKFIGEAEADVEDPCNLVNIQDLIPLELYGNINRNGHNIQYLNKLSTYSDFTKLLSSTSFYTIDDKLFYDIMPTSKYGILKLNNNSFLKSGELSALNILKSHNKITNWNFEINSDHAIIKWTYTTFKNDPQIDHIRFVFIPLDHTLSLSKEYIDSLYIIGRETIETDNIYKIKKLYYSGDFEDKVIIGENGLLPNYIYLCRLDVIYNNEVKNGSDYKLLYTGTFFNDKDVSEFSNDNRPQINIEIALNNNITTTTSYNYTNLKEDLESHTVQSFTTDLIEASDISQIADDRLTNTVVGTILNETYDVLATLQLNKYKSIKYEDKNYSLYPSFAGTLDEQNILNSFGEGTQLDFIVNSETEYIYNQEGKDLIEECKKLYIEQESINEINVEANPTILFIKDDSGKYTSSSVITVHRGIISELGLPKQMNVIHQGLFPVYDEDDPAYNELLLGFQIDEQDYIYNCIELDKRGVSGYLKEIGKSAYQFSEHPYKENAILLGNNLLIDSPGEYVSGLNGVVKNMKDAVINICITNLYQSFYADWEGSEGIISNWDFNNPFKNSLTMPHELCFNEDIPTGKNYSQHSSYYGAYAQNFKKSKFNPNIGTENTNYGFYIPQTSDNFMSIIWKTLYGPRMLNIATPLNISGIAEEKNLITLSKEGDKFYIHKSEEKYALADMHLRAEKMLLCLLSQILIVKCKNSILTLSAPETLYKTEIFNNIFNLNCNKERTISLFLNGNSIEEALTELMSKNILNKEDNFIPQFKAKLSPVLLSLGSNINIESGENNIYKFYDNTEYPFFSSVTQEQILNIYPGKIKSLKKQYLCQLEKDETGLYKINNDLLVNGKFYKVFLPSLIFNANNVSKPYSINDYSNYKFILEGYAYNDILLPATKIAQILGNEITQLRSQDSENPQFNLLYYNALENEKRTWGGVTLFGDLSAFINTINFYDGTTWGDYTYPHQLKTEDWINVGSIESTENEEEQTSEETSNT